MPSIGGDARGMAPDGERVKGQGRQADTDAGGSVGRNRCSAAAMTRQRQKSRQPLAEMNGRRPRFDVLCLNGG